VGQSEFTDNGRACIFSPKRPKEGPKRGFNICHMTDLSILIGGECLEVNEAAPDLE
jgi:hypothetical protein